jgi:hypothetical protein
MPSNDPARAAQLALLAHQLIGEGQPWAGSPLSENNLQRVATAATGALDHKVFLDALRDADDPQRALHDILAIAWAAGFKTGSMYSEQPRD